MGRQLGAILGLVLAIAALGVGLATWMQHRGGHDRRGCVEVPIDRTGWAGRNGDRGPTRGRRERDRGKPR
jgi:hypothetical protein